MTAAPQSTRRPFRRTHGRLGLVRDERSERRASWLDRDLRQRRRRMLWRSWRWLLALPLTTAAALAVPVWSLSRWPLLQAGAVGTIVGATAVGLALLVALADGSLLARLGRSTERDVGAELRRTHELYGTVSGVSFDRVDVDHVVIAPSGVFAVEVKSLWGRRGDLADTHGLDAKVWQARHGARKASGLLRGVAGVGEVLPVLVLAGPGAPVLDGPVTVDGVRVLSSRWTQRRWAELLTVPGRHLDQGTARAAAETLQAYCVDRREWEERRARSTRARRWWPRVL